MTRLSLAMLITWGSLATTLGQSPDATKPARPQAAARLANADVIRNRLGLPIHLATQRHLADVKIAVLDYGFAGMESGRPYLPAGTVLVEHYDKEWVRSQGLGDPDYTKGFDPGSAHGRQMAQIVWGMTGMRPEGPKFYLLNANGPTMLRRAVRHAVEQRVDVILFSNVFDGVGNGDGNGPINAIVDEAVAAGIIWINAAGNSGSRVYNGPIQVLNDGYVRLGADSQSTTLRFRNRLDENNVTVTLSWNSFQQQEDAGTDKDLDLFVVDQDGRVIGSSTKKQVRTKGSNGADESLNPRERVVVTNLAADERSYRILVKSKGGTFGPRDRLRVQISDSRETQVDVTTGKVQDAVYFVDASPDSEVQPPADHPQVITVGDLSRQSARGPTLDHRVKPDVLLESSDAAFTNGDVTAGSSNAAAYFAGVVVVLKAAEPGLRSRHLFAWTIKNAARNARLQATTFPDTPIATGPGLRNARDTSTSLKPNTVVTTPPRDVWPILERRRWQTPTPAELRDLTRTDWW